MTFGQILAAAEGRRRFVSDQATIVWIKAFEEPQAKQRVQMLEPNEVAQVLNIKRDQ